MGTQNQGVKKLMKFFFWLSPLFLPLYLSLLINLTPPKMILEKKIFLGGFSPPQKNGMSILDYRVQIKHFLEYRLNEWPKVEQTWQSWMD